MDENKIIQIIELIRNSLGAINQDQLSKETNYSVSSIKRFKKIIDRKYPGLIKTKLGRKGGYYT